MTRSQKEGDIRPQRKVNETSPEMDYGSGGRPAQITGKAEVPASTRPDNGSPGGVVGSGMMLQGSSGDMGDPVDSSADKEVGLDNLKKEGEADGLPEVGPTHSRGVTGVTPGEPAGWALEGVGNGLQCAGETLADRRVRVRAETRLARIREEAKENKKWTFSNLIHVVGDEEYLKSCFGRLRKDRAAGIDGVTMRQYGENLDENIRVLAEKIRRMSYIPQPVRRVYIPKGGRKWRPLGIPATEDKIVQVAMARILDAIYEPRFCDGSYGFRSGRSCHQALAALDREIMVRHVNWVLDADVERFFDSVDHRWMVECLQQKVKDMQFIRLIVRFLKAGVMEEGRYEETDQGTPQGGIISPILSNIYLHYVVDLWVEQVLRKACRGYVQEIRYADDFVLLFKNKDDGDKAQKLLGDRLGKFGLKLSKEKTRLIEFGRFAGESARRRGEKPATFDFLGFTHFVDKTRSGKFKLGRKTSGRKFGAKVKALKEWIRNIRNRVSTPQLWEMLKAKLVGHYCYFGVSGNYPMIRVFYRRAVALAFKWLNRRSQRKSFSWARLLIYIARYPLPPPRVYHRLYSPSCV